MRNLCFCQCLIAPFLEKNMFEFGQWTAEFVSFSHACCIKAKCFFEEIHRGLMSEDCNLLNCLYGHQTNRVDLEKSRRLHFPISGLGMATSWHNSQNKQYANERTARLNDACGGCTAETSLLYAWSWDGIWMFYFSLLRLWYLWIYLLNKMKISELWLTAQTQNEMVFSELNKVIQKVFLIIICSYQYFCILAFQFQRRDDYQWNTSHIFLYIRFAMHYFIMRFQKSGTTISW